MRARVRAGAPVTSLPHSPTLPAVGGNSPEIRLNSVVLPAPLGPRMARRSPGRTARATSLTATTPPKRPPPPRPRGGPAPPPAGRGRRRRPRWMGGTPPPDQSPKAPSSGLPPQGGGEPLV